MKGRNITDAAFYALFYGSLAGIAAGVLMFKAGQAGQGPLSTAGVTLAVLSIIPLAISGIIAYVKDAGRQRTRMEKITLALHCISGLGSITAITLMAEGSRFETGSRMTQASLLLWTMTTILHLASDKIRGRNGNNENAPGYAPDQPSVERADR